MPVETVVETLDINTLGDEEEYDAIRSFADSLGFYANVHQNYNPSLPGGPWYLQRKKKFSGRLEHEPSILKYSTADTVIAWLNSYARQEQEQSK
jgi:hypothetical protein